MSRRGRRTGAKRSYASWIIVGLVLVTAVVAYYIFSASGTTGGVSGLNGTPVSSEVLGHLDGVSASTLNFVGSGVGIRSPTAISSSTPLTLNGKPEVLYMGAEYCPYCAAQRWAMIVALDKFGSFTGLQYMQSNSAPEVFPLTSTFTFVNATYTSNYIAFESVEQQTRTGQALQSATSAQTSLLQAYDPSGSIPFIDFANQYVVTSAQYSPAALRVGNTANGAPYNWTAISSQLDNSSSVFAKNIDAAANRIISAICKIDGGAPSSVCSQGYASLLSYVEPLSPVVSPLAVWDSSPGVQVPSQAWNRLAPPGPPHEV